MGPSQEFWIAYGDMMFKNIFFPLFLTKNVLVLSQQKKLFGHFMFLR